MAVDLKAVSVEKLVENGDTWLTEHYGEDWALLIDLDTFNIGDGNHCVLGQILAPEVRALFPHNVFSEGMGAYYYADSVNLNGVVQDMGFEDFVQAHGFNGDFRGLQRAWVELISQRQEGISDTELEDFRWGYVQEINRLVEKGEIKRI